MKDFEIKDKYHAFTPSKFLEIFFFAVVVFFDGVGLDCIRLFKFGAPSFLSSHFGSFLRRQSVDATFCAAVG